MKFNMKEYRDFRRAFKIETDTSSGVGSETYIVLADSFAEAEDLYWNELNGYHPIISICAIENVKGVASRDFRNEQ